MTVNDPLEARERLPHAWLIVLATTVAISAMSSCQTLDRYHEFRSGWSWDLAYYNQWFWALTHGDGLVTVRPGATYAMEGPSVWKMNYLPPIRFVVAPLYAWLPDPRTLLVIHVLVFWLIIPASYTLVRAESRSERLALSAAALVPLTPLAWPLAWNDFRELQLAIPFVIWTIQGWRERRRGLAGFGIAGMLACRQEFAFVVLSLPLLPPQQSEPSAQWRRWSLVAVTIGFGWFLTFLTYLSWQAGRQAPADYLAQLMGRGGSVGETSGAALGALLAGLGPWSAVALFAPRAALLAVPWVWSISSGLWTVAMLATQQWHHVRYAAPMTALVLAAGLVGYARMAAILSRRPRQRLALVSVWSLTAVGLAGGTAVIQNQLAHVPRPIAQAEAERLWSWIARVAPDEGVLTAYDVAAPLSSRRVLYAYDLDVNRPAGFPRLANDIRWAFVRSGELPLRMFTAQGFIEVAVGPSIQVFRRADSPAASAPPEP